MPHLKFPDGAERDYPAGASALDVAESISKSLAKRSLAAKIDGEFYDLTRPIEKDAKFELVSRDDPDALELIRHDAAHVMAQAVQELFPGTQVTIGPTIEDGFFYDFARAEPFTPDDLPKIEAKMKEIVDRDVPIIREVWPRDEGVRYFNSIGEHYKAEIIEGIPAGEQISVYKHGNQWMDLCRGPHLRSTGALGKAFKLMRVAGAYWRGDHRNPMLQRIYGTAWRNEAELEAYLKRLEEAEKRDHRKLGAAMDLFHFQPEAQGSVFWHPKGWTLYRTLTAYMRRRMEEAGYQEVKTPQIMDRSLWERSGHWEKFHDDMFVCETEEGETLAVKPMNCPGHIQIFNHGQRSYRELPIRFSEFEGLHRLESSGSLHGTMRVRQLAQDDAHIFCREDQVESETRDFVRLLNSIYDDLGVELHSVKLALRPELRAGTDEMWDRTEAMLERAARDVGLDFEVLPGEGGFYAPKLEFHLRDAIGRTWQCGTLQLDMVMPERLDATYIGEDGQKHRPVMLHRAICGSMERFLGVLIEHYAGAFPLWLAPVQAVVATITSDADPYAAEVLAKFRAAGLRAELDVRNEKINYKIREHSLAKVPVIVVVGRKEAESGQVALRRFGGEAQTILSVADAVAQLKREALAPDLARETI